MKVKITRGKFNGINTCADNSGVIAALAVDHRDNLLEAIARARGEHGQATAADMLAFKRAVTRVLTPTTSAILLDPEYGLEAIASRAPGKGVLLAYEKSGYDFHTKGRLPDLLPEWSIRRLVEAGWVAPDATVVVERAAGSPAVVWPAGWGSTWERCYGDTLVLFAQRK